MFSLLKLKVLIISGIRRRSRQKMLLISYLDHYQAEQMCLNGPTNEGEAQNDAWKRCEVDIKIKRRGLVVTLPGLSPFMTSGSRYIMARKNKIDIDKPFYIVVEVQRQTKYESEKNYHRR